MLPRDAKYKWLRLDWNFYEYVYATYEYVYPSYQVYLLFRKCPTETWKFIILLTEFVAHFHRLKFISQISNLFLLIYVMYLKITFPKNVSKPVVKKQFTKILTIALNNYQSFSLAFQLKFGISSKEKKNHNK